MQGSALDAATRTAARLATCTVSALCLEIVDKRGNAFTRRSRCRWCRCACACHQKRIQPCRQRNSTAAWKLGMRIPWQAAPAGMHRRTWRVAEKPCSFLPLKKGVRHCSTAAWPPAHRALTCCDATRFDSQRDQCRASMRCKGRCSPEATWELQWPSIKEKMGQQSARRRGTHHAGRRNEARRQAHLRRNSQ